MDELVALLQLADLNVRGRPFAEREARLWLVEYGGQRAVLRCLDSTALTRRDPSAVVHDRTWLHRFLDGLAVTGFPAPAPIGAFDGESIYLGTGGRVWELLSFVEGDEIGWSSEPGMHAVGMLLARYHDAVAQVRLPEQRPTAIPLDTVPGILADPSNRGLPSDLAHLYQELAAELEAALETVRHAQRASTVIHGDFTNHNVVTSGEPLQPVGVIDFGLAHVEVPLADIGYGLWRSGRPYQEATFIDAERASAFVRGYSSIRPLTEADLLAVTTYIFGRGLQMLAKRIAAAPSQLALAQVLWLRANHSRLAEQLILVGRQGADER